MASSKGADLASSYSSTSHNDPRNRRVSINSVHIPSDTGETWYELLKRLVQLKFRRASPHSNQIHTTKYTLLTFLPKNLFEQFHRLANLYFLLIIILNFIPAIEVFGKEVSWVPLFVILTITALKDGFEDYRRYKSDKQLNALPCFVFDSLQGEFVQKTWKDVRVGDMVRLTCDSTIPADLLLLWSSDADNLCYIQTSNLDGETNLKQRQVPVGVMSEGGQTPSSHHSAATESDSENMDYSRGFNPQSFNSMIHCEPPNEHVYKFRGFVEKYDGSVLPLNQTHLLLRGCILRNTDCVVGIVVYAGHETKALLNNSGIRAKRSQLERDINKDIISQVILLFVLCLIGAILSGIWTARYYNKNIVFFPFSSNNINPIQEIFVRFWSFVIIFQVLVPVSLYVTIEIVKFTQVFFLNWDKEMFYDKLSRSFECRALNINEDLGQIKYVFSDKTGTLTENEMVFKCCSIEGNNYLHSLASDIEAYSNSVSIGNGIESTDYPSPSSRSIDVDQQLLHRVQTLKPVVDLVIHDFFITMAICNTVVVSQRSHSGSNRKAKSTRFYEAESPDEYALVEGANAYGYSLLSRSSSLVRIRTPTGEILEFDQLHSLEFTSDRKRMSVIVRNRSTGVISLYCKGADSVIFSRLCPDSLSIQHNTQEHLDYYARVGLRTLCLAKRDLSEEEYQQWLVGYDNANLDLENREELVFKCADTIERKLQLLGATGIEDRLQDGVQDTIMSLRQAGMKVWVLTGDKKETAINVGYASGLLNDTMEILHLRGRSESECLESLKAHIHEVFPSLRGTLEASQSSVLSQKLHAPIFKLQSVLSWSSSHLKDSRNSLIKKSNLKALVVDGTTLNFAFTPTCRNLFVSIAKECYSVVCCRASPHQKARVVELVKESEPSLTLAIGDGANDVSMIQMANVGIGIAGKEGMQAVLASDFNMGRFKYLKKLLLVHGHWCYSRLANMMLYFFYKNTMYSVLLFWFQLFNGFSGSNPIDGLNLQIFNLVYTSMPIMVAAVGDQDLKKERLLANPSHYQISQQSKLYTRWKFWLIVLEGIYQSVVIFFITYAVYYDSDIDLAQFGFIINTGAVWCASIHMAIEVLHWTWVHHFFIWGSILLFYVINYVYCALDTQQRIMDTYFVMMHLSADLRFWLLQLLIPIIALLPRLIGKAINQDIFPDSVLIGRANEKKSRPRTVPIDLNETNNTSNNHNYYSSSRGVTVDSPAKSIDS